MQQAQVGPYRLIRMIGQGSFGAVYEASHLETQAKVALKVLRDPAQVEEEDFRRFWLEGQVGLRLRDPAIVPVLEVGRAATGLPYLAMEYVEGPTLSAHLRERRRLEVEEATRLIIALARGVAKIHDAGVLHRDLKPANVILDARSGLPRITDFGLARDPTLIRSLTQTGERLGTPAYMAPEQAAARKGLDPRVDVFALGVIYFECLTGSRPHHQAGSVLALFDQIVRVPSPPPSARRPDLPPAVDAICARALALDPNDRYLDCRALADDLASLLSSEEPAPQPSRQRTLLVSGALALLLGGLAAFGALSLTSEEQPPAELAAESPPGTGSSPPALAPPQSLAEAAAEVARLHELEPARARALAQEWSEAATRRLEFEPGLEARELSLLAELLRVAGKDPAPAASSALARWLAAREQSEVDLRDRDLLHVVCEKHLGEVAVSSLDLWFAESLLGRGRFSDADRSFEGHHEHLLGEARAQAQLVVAYAASGRRTGWNVTPTMLSELARSAPPDSVAGLSAKSLLITRQVRWIRGDPSRRAKALDQALALARDALAREPSYLPARIALAGALTRQESPDAHQAWEEARACGPRNVLVPLARERAYRHDEGIRRAARDRFLSLTRGTTSYPRARNLLRRGWERVLAGQEGAREDLTECRTLRPFELRTHFGLGLIALREGDRAAAQDLLSLALAFPPEHRGRREGWQSPAMILQQLDPAERGRVQQLGVLPTPIRFLAHLDDAQRSGLFPAALASMRSARARELRALFEQNLPSAKADPVRALVLARLCVGRDMLDLALLALESCPPNREAELLQADVARRRGFTRRAQRAYERLAQGSDSIAALARGEVRLSARDWEGAQQAVSPLASSEPALAYRAELIRGAALLEADPGGAVIALARARRLVGDLDSRATILQLEGLVRLIAIGERAWLPEEPMRDVLFLAPGGNAVLLLSLPLLELARAQSAPELLQLVEQLLVALSDDEHPRIHVALGTLRLLQRGAPSRVFEHWKRALELDPEVEFPRQDLDAWSKLAPSLAEELEALRPRGR